MRPLPPIPTGARRWLTLTVALVAVYVALDVVAQLLPPHYSPISQAESDLAVGPYGFVMTANFVVRGILSLAFLVGLAGATTVVRRSPVGTVLLGVWAIGAFVLAASPTDVGTGPATVHGTVHLLTATIAFVAAAVGEVLLSLRFAGDPRTSPFRTSAIAVSVAGAGALVALLAVEGRPRIADQTFGLFERLFLGLVLLWMLAVAWYLLRHPRSESPTSGAA
jgi:hypothetical protein